MHPATDYAYAIARLRAIEARLPGQAGMDRLLDTRSVEEAFHLLVESGIRPPGDDGTNPLNASNFEAALNLHALEAIRLLQKIAPDPELFQPFLAKNDFHNLKVFIKTDLRSFHAGKTGQEPADDGSSFIPEGLLTGNIPAGQLFKAFKERKWERMPAILKTTVDQIMEKRAETAQPGMVDRIADRQCYQHMHELARQTGVDFIQKTVQIMADLTNIKAFFRIRKLGLGRDFLLATLVGPGDLSMRFFSQKFGDSSETMASALRFTAYAKLVEEGNEDPRGKAADDFLVEHLRTTRFQAFGPEPLIAHWVAKEFECMNLRMIMTGKIHGIPAASLKERLRISYV